MSYNNQYSNNRWTAALWVAVPVLLVVAFFVALDVAGFNPLAAFINGLHTLWASVAPAWPIWFALAAVAVCWMWFAASDGRNPFAVFTLAFSVLVLLPAGLFFGISAANRFGHDVANAAINETLTVAEANEVPDFEPRRPFVVSAATLQRTLGETAGLVVNAENVWRFEIDGVAQTCGVVLAEKNSWKRPVNGVVCVTDDSKAVRASFDGQVPSPLASFGKLRLADKINDLVPRGRFEVSDIYGFIRDGEAHMVVPVTKMTGGTGWVDAWAGAVVFDGDANATLVVDATEIPGPAAGESLADEVLGALNSRGGFMESRNASTAYDLADATVNPKHLLLELADGEGDRMVTALTPKGSSQTPTALLVIDPSKVEVGGWPQAVLFPMTTSNTDGVSRMSYGETADFVTKRYGSAMQIANNGLQVLEVAPVDADVVSVTIGSLQQVFARVDVNQLERTSCVFRPDGTQVRCDAANAQPLPVTGLSGLFDTENNDSGGSIGGSDAVDDVAGVPGNGELSQLSDVELAELLAAISEEFAQRSAANASSQTAPAPEVGVVEADVAGDG